jgi:hypothetical protein
MLLAYLPDDIIRLVMTHVPFHGDLAALAGTCKVIASLSTDELKKRRVVLEMALARGARYSVMHRLSMEYTAIPEQHRMMEHCAPSGTMSWSRIDTQVYPNRADITGRWFELLAYGDVLLPSQYCYGGKVIEKSSYGSNQIVLEGTGICYAYPNMTVAIPPRTDIVVM